MTTFYSTQNYIQNLRRHFARGSGKYELFTATCGWQITLTISKNIPSTRLSSIESQHKKVVVVVAVVVVVFLNTLDTFFKHP